jgi:hypothetical protein
MEDNSSAIYSAMQAGEPYSTYRKTVLGKVYVNYMSPFTQKPEAVLLEGEPKTDERAKIDLWSLQEDLFFRRMNKKHFDAGEIIKVDVVKSAPVVAEKKPIEQYSDEELLEVLKLKTISFKTLLSEITTPAVVTRLLDLAREEEKSEKMIQSIEAKLSELQMSKTL